MQPYHAHKKSRFKQDFKTLGDVFDLTTEETLWKLMSQGVFEGLEAPLSIGKEANVFTAITRDNERRIVKIYRVMTSDFTKMYSYIRCDPRFQDIHKNKRSVINAWCQREYKNLLRSRQAGCRVPTPFAAVKNVLVMEYIGGDGPAQKLSTEPPKNSKAFCPLIIENMRLLHAAGMVHGDLSPYNILNHNEQPVFIDFSQATTRENANYDEFFSRDIKNMTAYFKTQGIKITEEELKQRIENSKK